MLAIYHEDWVGVLRYDKAKGLDTKTTLPKVHIQDISVKGHDLCLNLKDAAAIAQLLGNAKRVKLFKAALNDALKSQAKVDAAKAAAGKSVTVTEGGNYDASKVA